MLKEGGVINRINTLRKSFTWKVDIDYGFHSYEVEVGFVEFGTCPKIWMKNKMGSGIGAIST